MCLIQPIIMIFSIFWYKILISVSAVGIGIMDLFFAFTSLQVLRKETQTISALSNPGNTKGLQYYEVVAKYSVQASVSMMVVLVCFAIQAYFQLESRDLDKTEIIYYCTELGIHSFVLLTLYSLTWMKYALDALSKMKEKKSRRIVSSLKSPLPGSDRRPSQVSSIDLVRVQLAHSRRPASEIPQPKQVKSQQPSCDITSTKSADSMRRACSDNSIRK
ncbi:hypothetical protein BDR26DRAFT_856827 [Obelidium mucronatum]|nr:hypothetical protein BDR26DRAFT_856827 [Obelidium mucronatum]